MTAANLLSYSAQIALLVLASAALPRALGLRSPGLQYLFWRALLLLCLLLPMLEPWRAPRIPSVPATTSFASSAVPGRPTPRAPGAGASFGAIATAAGVLLLAGIGARLAWLGAGVLRLRWMRENATEPADGFADLQHTIGVTADIRWSREVRHPVTFGTLQPVVLLPMSLRAADEPARRAVVAHELHHAKRRDWAWVVGEEIVRSIFWFHPAVRWLISRVQLARETVVDELSILTTNARRAYLDALLAFADDSGLVSTPTFSARRHLFHRVMLLSKEGNMSSSKVALASCVLVAAVGAGSWGAVRAFPLSTTAGSGAHDSARDQNLPADVNAPQQTRPTPGQLPPPTPPPPRDTREIPPPPPPPPPAGEMPESFKKTIERLHPVRLSTAFVTPQKIKDVQPIYPEIALQSKIEGTVDVETIVDSTGHVADQRVVRGVPELNDAALQAISQWEFTPPRLNGEPTAIIFTCAVTFKVR